jgi:NAD+ synthase (glutamine-hydrolysing)
MRLALAQLNSTVGDIPGNERKARGAIEQALDAGAQLVVFPELFITGYPPEDLLLKDHFLTDARAAVERLAGVAPDLVVLMGLPARDIDVFNTAAVLAGGRVQVLYRKVYLPNYGVFDEHRYFEPGRGHILIETPEGVLGVCVCEDSWSARGPVVTQGDAGAQVVININASPYHKNKLAERIDMLGERARRARSSRWRMSAAACLRTCPLACSSHSYRPTRTRVALDSA